MTKKSKFQPLTDYLINNNEDSITLTFSEIEEILGFKFEGSYRTYRQNWANNIHERPYKACMSAGYKFANVNMSTEVVKLIKVGAPTEAITEPTTSKPKLVENKKHQTNGASITNEMIEEAHQQVKETSNYGREDDLITDCFLRFPKNTDVSIVAMKIGLIDITNSTHLSQHKSKISAVELAECIVRIENIDERIKNGDPEVVNEIARCNGNINLFSFASKYCCYHNKNLYGRDDYSILDTVLKEHLPDYFADITSAKIDRWQKAFDYKSYNDYLTRKLDELGITVPFRKRKLDRFIWFNHR